MQLTGGLLPRLDFCWKTEKERRHNYKTKFTHIVQKYIRNNYMKMGIVTEQLNPCLIES